LQVPHKILIVDDEESILFGMRVYFMTRSFEVDCARGLQEAKALLGRGTYSAVIADLCLAESRRTDGLEIVEWVRTRYPGTRVIILTAYGSEESEREARRRGVDAFLHKPKPLPEVARIVCNLLRTSPPAT
jgi:DNA-binding response OmpR family regulator